MISLSQKSENVLSLKQDTEIPVDFVISALMIIWLNEDLSDKV